LDAPGRGGAESNLLLSLSLEDHSGASSTCFAFCCAGAQPFLQQQRHAAALENYYGGTYSRAKAAAAAQQTPAPGPGGRPRKPLTRAQNAVRKRRHSIGNVGLHEQQQQKAEAAAAAAASSSSVAASTAAASSDSVALSSGAADVFAAPDAAAITSATGSSAAMPSAAAPEAPKLKLAPKPVRGRAASICTGMLAAFHAAAATAAAQQAAAASSDLVDGSGSGTGALSSPKGGGLSLDDSSVGAGSFVQSPRRRINSAEWSDRTLLVQTPCPPGATCLPGCRCRGLGSGCAPTPLQSPIAPRQAH